LVTDIYSIDILDGQTAEERYTSEVIAHAESIKAIGTLKDQLSSAQAALRDKVAAAETARANLVTSEGSWKQQKETLSKEVADLNTRYVRCSLSWT